MSTEPISTDSLKSLRSFCEALEKRFQELIKAQQRQNELFEFWRKGRDEDAKHMLELEETCRKLALECQESKKQNSAEKAQLTTTIRRLVANLEARSKKSGKGTTKP
jgi:hypothetical protein